MKKIIRLNESDLTRIVKKVISESRYDEVMNVEIRQYVSNLVEPYLESGAIKTYTMGDYLIVDFETPTYFSSVGFQKSEVHNLKNKLRNKGFLSLRDGKYVKKFV
jgi:hypothetical protein